MIQRCLDHASKKQKADLAQVVAENALELVKDQYGNYVVTILFGDFFLYFARYNMCLN